MPILNMVWWWKKWGNIWEPLNLTVTTSWLDATITWEDNEIWTIPPTTFQKSELVRKIGSAPTSPSDWVLVVTETVKDTYKVSGYTDSWLIDWTTYYYRVFSYSDLGGISYGDAVSVTPQGWWQPWANTLAYWKFDGNLDSAFTWWATLSWTPYGYSTWIDWQALENTNNVQLDSSLTQWDIYSWAFAIAFCVNIQNSSSIQRIFAYGGWPSWSVDIQYEFYNNFSWLQVYTNGLTQRIAFPLTNPWIWVWKNIVVTWDGVNQIECYIDGVKTNAYSDYNTTFTYPSQNTAFSIRWSDGANNLLDWVIIENKHWTQSDVDLYLSTYPIS